MELMLAKRYAPEIDPAGWWVSEKFDGWRAMWTGREFVSREGNILPAPGAWISQMPGCALDGEIWLGRGRFSEMNQAIRCSDWSALQFVVFDAPECPGAFEVRQAFLAALTLPYFCSVAKQIRCAGRSALNTLFTETVSSGGEGLMLRAANSRYEQGRSSRLLKLKPKGIE